MTNVQRSRLAKLGMLLTAIIWGSGFFVVKGAVDEISPALLLGSRYLIAAVALGAVFFPRIRRVTRGEFARGAVVGLFLFVGSLVQTIGITDTTPGKNAFLTGVYCVLVPFLYWIVSRRRPAPKSFAAAFLCLSGIGLVSLTSELTVRFGDWMTLISGFLFACHIVSVGTLGRDVNPVVLCWSQLVVASALNFAYVFIFEGLPAQIPTRAIPSILYLSIFSTAIGFLLQMLGQRYVKPSAASLILSLESVFGVLFSVLFYGETLTPKLILGFLIIFVSILVSELDFHALRAGVARHEKRAAN